MGIRVGDKLIGDKTKLKLLTRKGVFPYEYIDKQGGRLCKYVTQAGRGPGAMPLVRGLGGKSPEKFSTCSSWKVV